MNRKYSIFLWFILALGSCSKTKTPTTPTTPISPAGVDVYITGSGTLNTVPPATVARYWKNNNPFDLSFSTTSYSGRQIESAVGIAVAGDDLYICGFGVGGKNLISGLNNIAKYWKNGVSVNLTDDRTNAYASAIGIDGSDVYVTGTETTDDLMQKRIGKYWKNGVGVILPGTAYPTDIAISGKDVYISGSMRDSLKEREIAVYWKNEIPVRLSDGSSDARANAILIDGSDIYVAGNDGNRAVYWKNQVPVYLTDGSTPAALESIAVEGTDVVAAGNIGPSGNTASIGTYWKNGIPVTVGEKITLYGAALADGNLFVVGNIDRYPDPSEAGYWINNERQTISDKKSNSSASQILVIKH